MKRREPLPVERYLGEKRFGKSLSCCLSEDSCCYALKVSADDEVSRFRYIVSTYFISVVHPAFPAVRGDMGGAHGRRLSGDVLYGKNIADADGQEIVSGRSVLSRMRLSWMMQLAEDCRIYIGTVSYTGI